MNYKNHREWLVTLLISVQDMRQTMLDYLNDLENQIEIEIQELDENQIDKELSQNE